PLRRRPLRAVRPGRGAALGRAARALRARPVAGRAHRVVQPRHAPEAAHRERAGAPPRGDRGGRADGGARPAERPAPQGPAPAVRGPGRDGADEHAHPRGGRGDVRPHRDHPGRALRRLRDAGGTPAPDRQRGVEPGGDVPQAHRRRAGRVAGRGARGVTAPAVAAPRLRPAGVARLLEPKWRAAMARMRREESGGGPRVLLLALLGFGFWAAAFWLLSRATQHSRVVEESGRLRAGTSLSVALLAPLLILLLSYVVTALSTSFLAKDLDLVVAAPLAWLTLHPAKLTD